MGSRLGLAAALVVASACASTVAVAPIVTTPQFPDFVRPTVPAELADGPGVAEHERAWLFLQSGDLRAAEHEASTALSRSPTFYPAETASGYVAVARNDGKAALVRFDRALSRRHDYAPALAGKGQALALLNRDGEAIDEFKAALAADPSLTDLQRRIEVLQFGRMQREVGSARAAVGAGNVDEAVRLYRSAIEGSPESPFLYRELAALERDRGDADAALDLLRRANAIDPNDAASLVAMAELLETQGDIDGALKAYDESLVLEPSPSAEMRRDALRARAEAARLPADYRAIESAPEISRGDLAALIGFRVGPLLESALPRDIGVITDVRGHWAEFWILAVTRAGVMDAFANHTFQPGGIVRRVDFAVAMTRLLDRIGAAASAAPPWRNARGRFSDIEAGHLAYPAASAVVAAGVMTAAPDGSFQPSLVVSGAEAIASIEQVRRLAGLPERPTNGRP